MKWLISDMLHLHRSKRSAAFQTVVMAATGTLLSLVPIQFTLFPKEK